MFPRVLLMLLRSLSTVGLRVRVRTVPFRVPFKHSSPTSVLSTKRLLPLFFRTMTNMQRSGPEAAHRLVDFVNASPTPFHAVQAAAVRLEKAGFQKVQVHGRGVEGGDAEPCLTGLSDPGAG